MSESYPGHGQILLCDSGTLATTPVDPIAFGISSGVEFKRTNWKGIKDDFNKEYRYMMNFMMKGSSNQSTMFFLDKLIQWLNLNCDAQYLSSIQAVGGDPDCYKFIGDRKAGLGFELLIDNDKRILTPTLEIALPYTDGKAFVDGADSDTPVTVGGITGRGDNKAYYRTPSFVAFEFPSGSTVFNRGDISKRSYSIKTKETKSEVDNHSIVHYLEVTLMVTIRDASVAKQVAIQALDNDPSIKLKELNIGAYYDQFLIPAGALTIVDDFSNTQMERVQNLTFKGDIFIPNITFDYGAAYGGGVSDGGTDGGTMNFG